MMAFATCPHFCSGSALQSRSAVAKPEAHGSRLYCARRLADNKSNMAFRLAFAAAETV